MNILLTGHEGYLGSRLHQFLKERDHVVIGIGRQEDIATITRTMLDKLQIELVINCATIASRVNRPYVVGGADEKVNLFGTRQLVKALAGTDIGLIHLSTKDVYGDVYAPDQVQEMAGRLIPAFGVNEQQPFRPLTIYAKTKLIGEFVAESHPQTTILRLSCGYTSYPHQRGNWILHFCRAAKNGNVVCINGSGKQLRDPLHVDDLGALILLIQARRAWGFKFNAGGGLESAYSILEVLNMIDPDIRREFNAGGDLGYITDISYARKMLDWQPILSFPAELQTLVKRVSNE